MKLLEGQKEALLKASLPARERGLKRNHCVIAINQEGSLPARERGLKLPPA